MKRIIPASILSAIGAVIFLILPILLGAAAEAHDLDNAEIGWLGSSYLLGFTLGSLSGVLWIVNSPPRKAAGIGLTFSVISLLLMSATNNYPILCILFLVCGAGSGGVMALATYIIGCEPNQERGYGIKLLAEQILGASLFFILPAFVIASGGFSLLTFTLALIFSVFGLSAIFLNHSLQTNGSTKFNLKGISQAHLMTIIGIMLFMFGLSGLWAFIERMGLQQSLSEMSIGSALAIALLFGAVGAALAAVLGNRLGAKIPHILTAGFLIVASWILSTDYAYAGYVIAAALISGLWNFGLAYQMAVIAKLDKSHQFSMLIIPAIALGSTFGPGVAGSLASDTNFVPVLILTALSVVVVAIIFVNAKASVNGTLERQETT